MSRRKKVTLSAFLFILPVCLVLYFNFLLNQFIGGLLYAPDNKTQISSHPAGSIVETVANKDSVADNDASLVRGNGTADTPVSSGSGEKKPNAGVKPPGQNPSQPSIAEPDAIAGGVQQQIDKPIAKKDLLKAGSVILRKLSWEEITFLYQSGSKDARTADEQKEIRRILLDKLTPEDVQTLLELGTKYGKTLNILDPNVPIK